MEKSSFKVARVYYVNPKTVVLHAIFFILKMNELKELKILKSVLQIFYHVILIKRMQHWGVRCPN